jgi:rubrerythrin
MARELANRASGTGCPACWTARRSAALAAVATERSIAARFPELIDELDLARNPQLDFARLGARSSRRLSWRCRRCDHAWQARVSDRTSGSACPECFRRRQQTQGPRSIPPARSLAARAPHLIPELHPDLNETLDPSRVAAGSNVTAWWNCTVCGCTWRARISNRARGSGCPACARARARHAG